MKNSRGFTIVELLIVIVVIGILASITVVAFNGVQQRARVSKIQSDINGVNKLIQAYNAEKGYYPVTTTGTIGYNTAAPALTDANCQPSGTKTAQWVPDLASALPQSDQSMKGVGGGTGCYTYISNGTDYLLSAWNMLPEPQTSVMYRRVGFREHIFYRVNPDPNANQLYYCNYSAMGGMSSGSYVVANDYYKRSYTFSNVTTCGETPPLGA